MDENLQPLLMDFLDGNLSPERRREVESLLSENAAARRFVADHSVVSAALEDAYGQLEGPSQSQSDFLSATVKQARMESRRFVPRARMRWLMAAAVLLLAGMGWWRWGPRPVSLGGQDDLIVRHLHVLEDVGFLQIYASELDLQGDLEILRAFDGELEGEG